MADVETDVLIVGASLGGVAAACRAAAMGARVHLLEATDWIGGQVSAQGVCTLDETATTESCGSTASYRDFRRRIREYYRIHYTLSAAAAGRSRFNPGNCWVGYLSVEPRVAMAILLEMLCEHPSITLQLQTPVTRVEMDDDRVKRVVSGDRGFVAPYVLDATDLGDLLPLAGAEHAIGAESRADTGEPDAPDEAHPEYIQPITFPLAVELRPREEVHTIARPPDYEALKRQQEYDYREGIITGTFGCDHSWWTYRRVLAAENFDDARVTGDLATINTSGNDFKGGAFPTGSPERDARLLRRARQASLGYLYWMQTECPRHDDGGARGYPELMPRPDIFGTEDGASRMPYIRESRRIIALKRIVEQEIVRRDESGAVHQPGPRATMFDDACGIGDYAADVHPGQTGDRQHYLRTAPYQIPLGALIPVRVANLIAACKNIGTTHLTNGAYRVHPLEWNIGESAGALAAFCASRQLLPRQVRESKPLLRQYQRCLIRAGVPVFWWSDVTTDDACFEAAQLSGLEGFFHGAENLAFGPHEPFTDAIAATMARRLGSNISWPAPSVFRAQAAIWLAQHFLNQL